MVDVLSRLARRNFKFQTLPENSLCPLLMVDHLLNQMTLFLLRTQLRILFLFVSMKLIQYHLFIGKKEDSSGGYQAVYILYF
jgi:hypothetical protein